MKHLLNNLSEEEKNSIREQHEGGMKLDTSRFKTLLEGKSGKVKPLVEQHNEMDEQFDAITNAVSGAMDGIAKMGSEALKSISSFIDSGDWKKYIPSTSALFGILGTETGKNIMNIFLDITPVGVIKNMSIAAANNDVDSLKKAFELAQSKTSTDLSKLKNSALSDLKSFGKLLQSAGINESISNNRKPLVEQYDDFEDDFDNIDYGSSKNGLLGSDDEDDYEDEYEDDFDNIDYGSSKNGLLGSDDEELDEDTSWMNEIDEEENEQYDEFEDEDNDTPTLKEKIESVIRDSITNKEEIIHTLEEILREKKGIGHVTRDKVRKHWDR